MDSESLFYSVLLFAGNFVAAFGKQPNVASFQEFFEQSRLVAGHLAICRSQLRLHLQTNKLQIFIRRNYMILHINTYDSMG